MPERRGASHHRDRVVEALKDEVGAILEGELADKRIGLCYVTEVVLNPGGKSARIYVCVDGDEQEAEQTRKAGPQEPDRINLQTITDQNDFRSSQNYRAASALCAHFPCAPGWRCG